MLSFAPSDGPIGRALRPRFQLPKDCRRTVDELPGQSWTDTVAPFGTTAASHWAVATVTRTQP